MTIRSPLPYLPIAVYTCRALVMSITVIPSATVIAGPSGVTTIRDDTALPSITTTSYSTSCGSCYGIGVLVASVFANVNVSGTIRSTDSVIGTTLFTFDEFGSIGLIPSPTTSLTISSPTVTSLSLYLNLTVPAVHFFDSILAFRRLSTFFSRNIRSRLHPRSMALARLALGYRLQPRHSFTASTPPTQTT